MIDRQEYENRDLRNIPKEKLVDLLRMTHEDELPETNEAETESSPAPDSPAPDRGN